MYPLKTEHGFTLSGFERFSLIMMLSSLDEFFPDLFLFLVLTSIVQFSCCKELIFSLKF